MVRNLRKGDRGPDVRAVQEALNLRRPSARAAIDEDGVFGNNTDIAVHAFQDDNSLGPDGVVGPLTRGQLFPLAAVTGQAFGMRLRMPSFNPFRPPERPGLFSGGLTLGDPPTPTPVPSLLPPLTPSFFYTPLRYPLFSMPVATPPMAPPPSPGLTFPIHHFELAPGFSGSLLPSGRGVGAAFTMSVSAIAVIGDEKRTHNEVSTGMLTSNDGSGWTIFWMTQITHVHQLNRAGNFSWQPNAQLLSPLGSPGGPTLSLSPIVFQWDANDSLSFSFAGPGASIVVDPNGASASVGLFSFGAVLKFGADEAQK